MAVQNFVYNFTSFRRGDIYFRGLQQMLSMLIHIKLVVTAKKNQDDAKNRQNQ